MKFCFNAKDEKLFWIFLTIYYFCIFNLINWIHLIQTNSDLIVLIVIVSLLSFFFSFC